MKRIKNDRIDDHRQDSLSKEEKMAALFEQVKKEHEITQNLMAKIKRLGVHTREGRDQLLDAKDRLLVHLEKDVESLYPELKKTAEENPTFRVTFEEFTREMNDITGFCTDFFKKYSRGGGGIEFFRDFAKLETALESRMQEEESLMVQAR